MAYLYILGGFGVILMLLDSVGMLTGPTAKPPPSRTLAVT